MPVTPEAVRVDLGARSQVIEGHLVVAHHGAPERAPGPQAEFRRRHLSGRVALLGPARPLSVALAEAAGVDPEDGEAEARQGRPGHDRRRVAAKELLLADIPLTGVPVAVEDAGQPFGPASPEEVAGDRHPEPVLKFNLFQRVAVVLGPPQDLGRREPPAAGGNAPRSRSRVNGSRPGGPPRPRDPSAARTPAPQPPPASAGRSNGGPARSRPAGEHRPPEAATEMPSRPTPSSPPAPRPARTVGLGARRRARAPSMTPRTAFALSAALAASFLRGAGLVPEYALKDPLSPARPCCSGGGRRAGAGDLDGDGRGARPPHTALSRDLDPRRDPFGRRLARPAHPRLPPRRNPSGLRPAALRRRPGHD